MTDGVGTAEAVGEVSGETAGVVTGEEKGRVRGVVVGDKNSEALGVANGEMLGVANGEMLGVEIGEENGEVMGDCVGGTVGVALGVAVKDVPWVLGSGPLSSSPSPSPLSPLASGYPGWVLVNWFSPPDCVVDPSVGDVGGVGLGIVVGLFRKPKKPRDVGVALT